MIIKTDTSTFYVTDFLEETDELYIFRGFKNIRTLKKITVRKIKLKKQFIISKLDLSKTIVLIGNKEEDIMRLKSIKQLVDLNKNSINYLPYNFMDINKLYNKMSKKMIEYK